MAALARFASDIDLPLHQLGYRLIRPSQVHNRQRDAASPTPAHCCRQQQITRPQKLDYDDQSRHRPYGWNDPVYKFVQRRPPHRSIP